MRFKLMALAATVSVALPAVAQTADPATPAPKKEKKICRREAVTGSYLGANQVCHTRSEWQKIDGANEEGAGRVLDRDRQRQNSGVSGGL